jgi:hypothetical protein
MTSLTGRACILAAPYLDNSAVGWFPNALAGIFYPEGGYVHRWSDCQKKNKPKWTSADWERTWQSASRRINGMPPELRSCPQIHESLTTLNEAFSEGDSAQFESALIVLLDHCAELVNRGEYQQWW